MGVVWRILHSINTAKSVGTAAHYLAGSVRMSELEKADHMGHNPGKDTAAKYENAMPLSGCRVVQQLTSKLLWKEQLRDCALVFLCVCA